MIANRLVNRTCAGKGDESILDGRLDRDRINHADCQNRTICVVERSDHLSGAASGLRDFVVGH